MIRIELCDGSFALVNFSQYASVTEPEKGSFAHQAGARSLLTTASGNYLAAKATVAEIERMIDDLHGPRSVSINPTPEQVAELMAMPRGGSPILPPEPGLDMDKLRYALRLALYRRGRRLDPSWSVDRDIVQADFDNGLRNTGDVSPTFQHALALADDIMADLVEAYGNGR